MNRGELALKYFKEGYNCSQAVVLAFIDLLDIDSKQAAKLASGFGGGMGRLREVCGAVSGMFMVVNMLYGYDGPAKGEKKTELYTRIQELGLQFEKDNGSIICREIMGLNVKHDNPESAPRTKEFYEKRPCPKMIAYAANILEEYINNHPYKV